MRVSAVRQARPNAPESALEPAAAQCGPDRRRETGRDPNLPSTDLSYSAMEFAHEAEWRAPRGFCVDTPRGVCGSTTTAPPPALPGGGHEDNAAHVCGSGFSSSSHRDEP